MWFYRMSACTRMQSAILFFYCATLSDRRLVFVRLSVTLMYSIETLNSLFTFADISRRHKNFSQSPVNQNTPSGRMLELCASRALLGSSTLWSSLSSTRRNRNLIVSKQHYCNLWRIRMRRANASLPTLTLWKFFSDVNYICTKMCNFKNIIEMFYSAWFRL